MAGMTKRERVFAAVRGDPVDCVPFAFCRHNHQAERSVDTCALNLLEQNERFGWDFVKVHPKYTFWAILVICCVFCQWCA